METKAIEAADATKKPVKKTKAVPFITQVKNLKAELAVLTDASTNAANAAASQIADLEAKIESDAANIATLTRQMSVDQAELNQIQSLMNLLTGSDPGATALVRISAYLANYDRYPVAAPAAPSVDE
jgi:uncharacterized protein HemX